MLGKKKMTCPRCGKKVNKDWNYCPYCGYPLREKKILDTFEKTLEKEFERFDKIFDIKLPKLRIEPGVSGISITITSSNRSKPSISIKPLKRSLLVEDKRPKFKEIPIEEVTGQHPKITEEPRTNIKHLGLKDVIEINLPGVKSPKDIQIRELEQSIEVKARAGDKIYFKLLPIPPGKALRKRFFKGKLIIEIER